MRGGYAAGPIHTAGPGAPQWRPPPAAAFIRGGGAHVMSPRRRALSGSSGRALRARRAAGVGWPGLMVAREMRAVLRMRRQCAAYGALSSAESRNPRELWGQPHRAQGSVPHSLRGRFHRAAEISPAEPRDPSQRAPGVSPTESPGSIPQNFRSQPRRAPGSALQNLWDQSYKAPRISPAESPGSASQSSCHDLLRARAAPRASTVKSLPGHGCGGES